MRWGLTAVGLLAVSRLAAQPATESATPLAAIRQEFAAAYAAATDPAASGAVDSPSLQGYVLYPYIQAARIERALEKAGAAPAAIPAVGAADSADDRALQFLSAHGGEPVALILRRAWLASLARRGQWQALVDHYDPSAATVALECQRLNARITLGDIGGLAPDIAARWLTPRQLPGDCEPAFQWLRSEGPLTDELIAQRATLLLDHGQTDFARVIARRLPADTATPLLDRAHYIQNPARAIDALLADSKHDIDYDIVLDAWSRLSRSSPGTALDRYAALTARLPAPEQTSVLALHLALGLAWDRRPEALEYFARVEPAQRDDYALEWFARAALWAGEWETAGNAIAAMSPKQRSESAWRYWAARVAEQREDRDAARALYRELLVDDNYYSAMAAARLGDRMEPHPVALALDAEKIDAISGSAAFVRARELQIAGLRSLATNEWRYGYDALDDDLRPQAIHVAAGWEMYDIAVTAATSHGVFNDYDLLYPRPYAGEVSAAEKLTDIDRALLYGVLRQESLFRADAASSADALGVAQLKHDTARIAARRWGLPQPSRADLFAPAINIPLGAARLVTLIEEFDGQLPVALAAYNAGENAAKRWLPSEPIDSDVWIENIPYNETRAYVRRVLWHSLVFEWLDSGRAQNTRGWLGEVAPPAD
jgi:soluble lytic murein transglycosylase